MLRLAKIGLIAALMTVYGSAGFAQKKEKVDLLLVLAADVSRSVDEKEFMLQRKGYADAITNPRVLAAISSGKYGRIAVTYMEWSSHDLQTVIVDWTVLHDQASANRIAEALIESPRPHYGTTGIGTAIRKAVAHTEQAPFDAERRTIDISGDGTSNVGVVASVARDEAVYNGYTINALVILSATPIPWNPDHTHPPGGLVKYFEHNVVGGSGSFVMAANGFQSFADAILKKMIAEIALLDTP